MKYYLLLITLFSSIVQAEKSQIDIYLKFEDDYMSNNVEKFEAWLPKKYKLIQTLHIPDVGSDTRTATRKQLLAAMKSMNTENKMPRSKAENSTSRDTSKNSFCVQANTISSTVVSGKNYEEKEVREACFINEGGAYKVTKHNIDVYYKEL